jgi:hypothetical protein
MLKMSGDLADRAPTDVDAKHEFSAEAEVERRHAYPLDLLCQAIARTSCSASRKDD